LRPLVADKLTVFLAAVSVAWRQREGTALVEAYSPGLKGWAVVAEGRDTPELTARDVAGLIVGAMNWKKENDDVFDELTAALEACLDCDGLDFTAEHAAEVALRKAGKRA
jgi:hypothetical protein